MRVIGPDGKQVGLLAVRDALLMAEQAGLDLVEIAPNAEPPVCKIVDYGKYRYDQTKKEKESKKAQHQIKVKEVKVKPNIDDHDFMTKQRQAHDFLEKGNKVKLTCVFRGREMAYPALGERVVKRMLEGLHDVGQEEAPVKMFGRSMIVIIAPRPLKSKKVGETKNAKDENE